MQSSFEISAGLTKILVIVFVLARNVVRGGSPVGISFAFERSQRIRIDSAAVNDFVGQLGNALEIIFRGIARFECRDIVQILAVRSACGA